MYMKRLGRSAYGGPTAEGKSKRDHATYEKSEYPGELVSGVREYFNFFIKLFRLFYKTSC